MEVKEFLQRGRSLNFEIDGLIDARNNAFRLACGTDCAYDKEKVQTTKSNVSENKFIKYADYSAEIDRRIDELFNYRRRMMNLICCLDDTVYRSLLTARYINCQTWEQVAETIGYMSVKWVRENLHQKALMEAEKFYK